MPLLLDKSIVERTVFRFGDGALEAEVQDHLAVEEPLEIRVAGDPVAVTMRTPGDDHRLAIGFLFSEGIIDSQDDLGTIAHCGKLGEEGYGNVIDCIPAAGANLEVEKVQAARRGTLTTSACGVCGRRSVDDLFELCGPVPDGPALSPAVVAAATSRLQDVQRVFARTGGTHAAVALDANGEVRTGFEDVGRHNAVDKVVGALVLRGLRAEGDAQEGAAILAVSGRASFEIIQKAARARIPVVASVSAASSLAVSLAERMNITLATFVRGQKMSVLTGRQRLKEG